MEKNLGNGARPRSRSPGFRRRPWSPTGLGRETRERSGPTTRWEFSRSCPGLSWDPWEREIPNSCSWSAWGTPEFWEFPEFPSLAIPEFWEFPEFPSLAIPLTACTPCRAPTSPPDIPKIPRIPGIPREIPEILIPGTPKKSGNSTGILPGILNPGNPESLNPGNPNISGNSAGIPVPGILGIPKFPLWSWKTLPRNPPKPPGIDPPLPPPEAQNLGFWGEIWGIFSAFWWFFGFWGFFWRVRWEINPRK